MLGPTLDVGRTEWEPINLCAPLPAFEGLGSLNSKSNAGVDWKASSCLPRLAGAGGLAGTGWLQRDGSPCGEVVAGEGTRRQGRETGNVRGGEMSANRGGLQEERRDGCRWKGLDERRGLLRCQWCETHRRRRWEGTGAMRVTARASVGDGFQDEGSPGS